MIDHEGPEELNSPPEKRLVGTLITQKPSVNSFLATALFIFFIILVTQIYWLNIFDLSSQLPAIKENIFNQNEWWRIFTSTLIHADLGHLLSNLYMLSILSFFVFGYFGFLIHPLYTFFGAGLVNALSIMTYHPHIRLLGASGLVYLLGGFWLTLYLFIQRQYRFSQRLIRVFGISLMIFFPTSFEPSTSYRTHFIGFFMGIIMAIIYFSLNKQKIRSHEIYEFHGYDFKNWN